MTGPILIITMIHPSSSGVQGARILRFRRASHQPPGARLPELLWVLDMPYLGHVIRKMNPMVFALNVSIMGVVISHVLKCNIRFLKPQVEGDSITGLRTLLNSRAYPIKRNKICLFHQWVGLTFLWVSLLFSMKCCLEKGPGFR